MNYSVVTYENYLEHHGILGQKWGVRRYQNPDGSLTSAGKKRLKKYVDDNGKLTKKGEREYGNYVLSYAYKKKALDNYKERQNESEKYFQKTSFGKSERKKGGLSKEDRFMAYNFDKKYKHLSDLEDEAKELLNKAQSMESYEKSNLTKKGKIFAEKIINNINFNSDVYSFMSYANEIHEDYYQNEDLYKKYR